MTKRCVIEVVGDGAELEVSVAGMLDVSAAKGAHARFVELVATPRTTVVDLTALERIDGAGLQLLVALRTLLEARGATLVLRGATEAVRRSFAHAAAGDMLA